MSLSVSRNTPAILLSVWWLQQLRFEVRFLSSVVLGYARNRLRFTPHVPVSVIRVEGCPVVGINFQLGRFARNAHFRALGLILTSSDLVSQDCERASNFPGRGSGVRVLGRGCGFGSGFDGIGFFPCANTNSRTNANPRFSSHPAVSLWLELLAFQLRAPQHWPLPLGRPRDDNGFVGLRWILVSDHGQWYRRRRCELRVLSVTRTRREDDGPADKGASIFYFYSFRRFG
jgi:hypothetical protein